MDALIRDTLISFFTTLLMIPAIIKIFNREKIHDLPDERKIHKANKPSMGGLAIFTGLVTAMSFSGVSGTFPHAQYFLTAMSLMIFVGVLDDLLLLKPIYKISVQVPASLLLIHFAGIRIDNFYGLFGIHEIPMLLAYPLTVFTFIVVINAFNLIDGIDGLAGSTAITIISVLGFWFYFGNNAPMATACFLTVGSLLGFLLFNWQPSKIFMGDTGALFLGFVLITLVIYFINNNTTDLYLPQHLSFHNNVTAGICLLILPLTDTLRIYIIRIKNGKSPFSPDKNHLHHVLLRLGFDHRASVLLLVAVNIFFILLAYVGKNLSDNLMLPLVILVATAGVYILEKADARLKGRIEISPLKSFEKPFSQKNNKLSFNSSKS